MGYPLRNLRSLRTRLPVALLIHDYAVRWVKLTGLGPGGCSGHIRVPSQMIGKLDPRALECIFVCYSAHSKGYVFVLERGGGELAEVESHDVEFF